MISFKYKIWDCVIKKGRYYNKRVRLSLVDEYGKLVTTASLNIPTYRKLKPDQIIIKDYEDNIGLLSCLQKNNIVGPTLATVPVGLRVGHIVKLLV
jgi:hypothetical protein